MVTDFVMIAIARGLDRLSVNLNTRIPCAQIRNIVH